jgi:DNA-binding NarL/FixJ family response regulator
MFEENNLRIFSGLNMPPIKVILVDDHSIVREGLRMIIENDDQIIVVGEAANMAEALTLVAREKHDVILLDLDFGTESSLERIHEIIAINEDSRILILTGITDEKQHQRAIQKGAHGILLKNYASQTLLKAIKKVYQGEVWIDRSLTAKLLEEVTKIKNQNSHEQLKISSLTNRELEIIKLIAAGLVNKEIASRLFVGEKTIRNRLTVIYSKLEISNRLELAIYASRNQLG